MIPLGRTAACSLLAAFVIQRRPGQGYCVTKAEGPQAKGLEEQALRLLNDLGRPDPNEPEMCHVLLGPFAGSNNLVAATITPMPGGEAEYRQWWYRLQTTGVGRLARWVCLACLFIAGIVLGAAVMRLSFDSTDGNKPAEEPRAVVKEEIQLRNSLAKSRDVRRTLWQYLSSVFESAAPKGGVTEARPRRWLVFLEHEKAADGPPQPKYTPLKTEEEGQLFDLLKALNDWEQLPNANTR